MKCLNCNKHILRDQVVVSQDGAFCSTGCAANAIEQPTAILLAASEAATKISVEMENGLRLAAANTGQWKPGEMRKHLDNLVLMADTLHLISKSAVDKASGK